MKRKVEVLAPCGSYEALVAAVQSGADAVYLGGSRFGARAFADNFGGEKMKEAVAYAHSYDVAVYVTVNTLIYDEEFKDVLEYTDYLYKVGVDALIIQDIGLLRVLRNRYPDIDLHASTQMHLHNIEAVQELVDIGVERVVLSRECSLKTIKEIHAAFPNLELEVFCYGALCISYSGQCLFSSMIGGRSGNRGECAQACRLPYELLERDTRKIIPTSGAYLLSPKDQNALTFVDKMVDAGVYSFKIEGRMKRPEYVASSVMAFRRACDAAINGEPFKVTKSMITDLRKVFNRGFTLGHMRESRGSDLMSQVRPNHVGVPLGKVTEIDKRRGKAVIKLADNVLQGDGIRIISREGDEGFTLNFLYKNGLLVSSAEAGDIIEIDLRDMKLQVGDDVRKTTDSKLMKEINELSKPNTRHIPISMNLELYKNQPIKLQATYKNVSVEVVSEGVADEALKRPITKERAEEQLSKLKDTPYYLTDLSFDSDNASITAISTINNLRREVVEKLQQAYVESFERKLVEKKISERLVKNPDGPKFSAAVYTKEQLVACLENHIELIFVRNEELYKEYSHLPEVVLASKRIKENNYSYDTDRLLCSEMGAVHLASDKEMYIDSYLNVANAHSIDYFLAKGAKRITLSEELSLTRLRSLCTLPQPVEVIVYGKSEVMISRHCVINTNTINTKELHCNMCKQHDYALIDRKKERFDIVCDEDCFNHILHARTLIGLPFMSELETIGIPYFRLNFTNESYEQTKRVVRGFLYDENVDVENGYMGYLGK